MSKTLLVVDDEESLCRVLKMSFESLGYQVFTAGNGEEGERLAHQLRPLLVIMDVMMPVKNGYSACIALKGDPATASIPIILLTAKSLKDDVYWGFDCGADAFVTKPYEPRELEALVEQLITEAASGKRSFAWTGLPDATKLFEEASARQDAGGEVFLLGLRFPDEPTRIFSQKFGQGKYRDLVHRIAWIIHEVIREGTSSGVVGQRPDDSFVILMHPSEAQAVKERVLSVTETAIKSYYGVRESTEGGITYTQRDPTDPVCSVRKTVPLLSLDWEVLEPPE